MHVHSLYLSEEIVWGSFYFSFIIILNYSLTIIGELATQIKRECPTVRRTIITDCLIHRQTDKLYKLFVKHTHTLTLHTFSLDARADITIRTI